MRRGLGSPGVTEQAFMKSALICQLAWLNLLVFLGAATSGATAGTRVSIDAGSWRINGKPTYPHSSAEGLLMNVRMVNAVFEDTNRPDFHAEANTDEFIARIPEYVSHGVRAFTICLQGGSPGYEGS